MKSKFLTLAVLLALCFALGLSLVACGENTTYTVTFTWNSGHDDATQTVAEGATPSLPEVPARDGYVFAGWYRDEALTEAVSPETVAVDADVTYYAAWTSDRFFRIAFDTKGGSAVAPVVLKKGDALNTSEITAPTKEGYTFGGWFKNESCTAPFNSGVAPVENMTLYAGWKLAEGMGECIGTVNGKEVARTVFTAGAPVLPETNDGVSYCWFSDAALTVPFAETSVSSSVTLYGIAYTDGLVIEGNTVTAYHGTERNVIVPALWNGVSVTAIGNGCFADQATLKSVVLPETVETVGASAFYHCTSLTSVNLTAGCTSVGAYAFSGCEKIVSVGDLSGLTDIADATFLGCRRLTGLSFPDGLQTVGAYAFSDCDAVESFDLPDTVVSIGEYAFSGCASVKEFHIPDGLAVLGTGALHGCGSLKQLTCSDGNESAAYRVIDGNLYEGNGKKLVLYVTGDKTETTFTLPAGANGIAPYAFSGNKNIKTLILADESFAVEKAALAGMTALEELSIYTLEGDNGYLAYYFGADSGEANGSAGNFSPETLKKVTLAKASNVLPDYAFYGFTGLSEVEGLSNLRKIGKYAFAYTALVDVQIPATLTAIGEKAFYACSSVSSFTVDAANTMYASFDGCLYNKALTDLYLVPLTKTEVTFPETVTKITAASFYKSNVKKLTIPASVTKIEAGAFAGVLSLEELTVPFIGGSATENTYMIYVFGGTVQSTLQSDGTTSYSIGNTSCTPPSLKKMTITGELTAIPDFAFAYLSDVTEIVCNGTITSIGDYAYCRSGLVQLRVPETVTSIGEYAFAAMSDLETATIPGSVGGNLGKGLFYNSSALETVSFGEGVTLIPDEAFYPSASKNAETNELNYYSNLESIKLPASLEKIGKYAFAYAGTRFIGEIGSEYSEDFRFVLPENNHITVVEEGAFYRSSISAITLSASCTEVKQMAFFGCENLATVNFGNATEGSMLATIGGAAFAMCKGLRTMTIYKEIGSVADLPVLELYTVSTTTENVSYNVFTGAALPTIYVHSASTYRTAPNWDEYDAKIFEIA